MATSSACSRAITPYPVGREPPRLPTSFGPMPSAIHQTALRRLHPGNDGLGRDRVHPQPPHMRTMPAEQRLPGLCSRRSERLPREKAQERKTRKNGAVSYVRSEERRVGKEEGLRGTSS